MFEVFCVQQDDEGESNGAPQTTVSHDELIDLRHLYYTNHVRKVRQYDHTCKDASRKHLLS